MPPKKIMPPKPVTRRHRAPQGSMQRGEPYFSRLPTEIISEIFLAYHLITQAPILLLLVCRNWRDIARSISFLWGTVRFQTWRNEHAVPRVERTMHWPITCLSWRRFRLATSRAGDAMISIGSLLERLDECADTNPDVRTWLSIRCRKLQLNLHYGGMDSFVRVSRNLVNLEELLLNGQGWAMEHVVSGILENLEADSPRLVNLETNGFFPTGLRWQAEIMKRLRRLSISLSFQRQDQTEQEALIEHLPNLEELVWPFNTPAALHHISENLKTLTISQCSSFPVLPFGRLSSLTLRCTRAPVEDLDVVDLPCLKHFIFSGFWERFALIRVGRLSTLDFECWELQDKRDLIPSASTRTRCLTITEGVSDDNMIELLTGIWSEVEEIHLVLQPGMAVVISRELITALSGTKHIKPLCPQLRHLTIKTTNRTHLKKSTTDRVESRLRAVARRRAEHGGSLQSIRWRWNRYTDEPDFSTGLRALGEDSFTIL